VQAGASESGRQLAAEAAEVIFGLSSTLADAKAFYADVKGRLPSLGRDPEHLKVLPAAFVVVRDKLDEAQAKGAHL
jgi:alkanesulfonate monooxygenase SsuD/methylene tetrahydromethanopterin reductase-like flavin-dependent oxidoreductase (luciferase family)